MMGLTMTDTTKKGIAIWKQVRELTNYDRVWVCKYKSQTCQPRTSLFWHHNNYSNKL
ncbi:hypothetical protein ACS0TY_013655 [Phlomoides rotata]